MKSISRSPFVRTLVVAAIVAGAVIVPVVVARPLRPAASSVATVNLPVVLEGLNQRADAESELRTLADEIRVERDRRESELDDLTNQRKDEVDPDRQAELEEQIALKTLNYQAWLRFTSDKLDVERALLMQSLYRSIQASIKTMSEAEGFDLVLLSEGSDELVVNPEAQVSREAQIRQQMSMRRVVYSNPAVDITDDLVARMNNAYLASPASSP
jgi:Skp family chaperone for outer membrane proteins